MLHGCTVSEMCDFHLLTLDLNFIKKILIDKRFSFWETFNFWNLEVLNFLFQILRLCNLEIVYFKSKILSFRILKIKAWNFDNEIWSLKLKKKKKQTRVLVLNFGHWECEIASLGMKVFELTNWDLELFLKICSGDLSCEDLFRGFVLWRFV